MSEQDSAGVVQQFLKAMIEGDAAVASQLLADDVVLVSPGPKDLAPWSGEYHGPTEALGYWTAFNQAVEVTGMAASETIAQGDKVVVLGHHEARVRATGKTYSMDWATVYTVRDGKVAGVRSYHDTYLVAEAARSD
jgi:ketosteroid isomerase-like protein